MSRDYVVSRRYAKALFELAKEQHVMDSVEKDLAIVVNVTESVEGVKAFLTHPNIDTTVKIAFLKDAFEERISPLVFNTVKLLVERGRANILPAVLEAYMSISNEFFGRAKAVIYTPYPLEEEEAHKIADKFAKLTGKQIRVENVVDKSLIGGFQVRIDDRLYDASISGKLARIRKKLSEAQAL